MHSLSRIVYEMISAFKFYQKSLQEDLIIFQASREVTNSLGLGLKFNFQELCSIYQKNEAILTPVCVGSF